MLNRVSFGQDFPAYRFKTALVVRLCWTYAWGRRGDSADRTTTGMPVMKSVATETLPAPSYTRLSSQFGDPGSGLRAVTELSGSAVVIHVGGDVDASNDSVWRRMVNRTASIASAPGPLVVDVRALDFMGSCTYVALADEAVRC